MSRITAALGAVALWCATGCPGDLQNVERFADCPPGTVEAMFEDKCGGICHGANDPEAGLDLVSPGVEARLVGEMSSTTFCDGAVLIDPDATDPVVHLLYDKVQESPSCGSRMPFGQGSLSNEERECLRRWIDDTLGGGS